MAFTLSNKLQNNRYAFTSETTKKVLKCMYMKYDTCLNSSSVDAILVVFAYLFTKPRSKQAKRPSLVRSPEKLLRANFAGVRHAWVNKPIKAEYSNL